VAGVEDVEAPAESTPQGRRLQLAEVEVEARSEQDQRPKRRRHDCRDDLGDGGQVGVVIVLGGDDHAEHNVYERGQTAHAIILCAHGALLPGPGVQRLRFPVGEPASARLGSRRKGASRTGLLRLELPGPHGPAVVGRRRREWVRAMEFPCSSASARGRALRVRVSSRHRRDSPAGADGLLRLDGGLPRRAAGKRSFTCCRRLSPGPTRRCAPRQPSLRSAPRRAPTWPAPPAAGCTGA